MAILMNAMAGKDDCNRPAVSIIVPVYKVEGYLVRCLESLLKQTFIDFEILLINDGSPDRSGEICDEYALKDSRIRVFHKNNGGVSSARNLALDYAKGEYVTFVDADDWIDTDCLEKGIQLIRQGHLDILQYSYRIIREKDGDVISIRNYDCPPMSWREFVKSDHYMVCVGGNFIRKAIIDALHLRFDESLHLAEDQIFIMTAISLSGRIAQTKGIYYNYFQNSASATHNSKEDDIIDSSIALLAFGKNNSIFKPQIDRMISCFYIELLVAGKGRAKRLNTVYHDAHIKYTNLPAMTYRLLCMFSFLGMDIAGWIVIMYLRVKTLFYVELILKHD